MATHSSVLAWRIPGMGEPLGRGCIPGSPGESGLVSRGSQDSALLSSRDAGLPDHAGESPLLSRSGGEKGLRGSGAGTLGVPLGGTRRVGGLLEPLQYSSVAQSCPTLCDPVDCSTPGFPVHHQLYGLCSPPGSLVYGILQARLLEWVGSGGSKRPASPLERRAESWLPLETRLDSLGEPGMQPRDP